MEIPEISDEQLALLDKRGWDVVVEDEDGNAVEAAINVDIARTHTTFPDNTPYGLVWSHFFPDSHAVPGSDEIHYEDSPLAAWRSPTYATWRLNFPELTAETYLCDGILGTIGESWEEMDYDLAIGMELRHVEEVPLTRLVEGYGQRSHAFYDLVVADKDWSCDLVSVTAGEHLVRVRRPEMRDKDGKRLVDPRLGGDRCVDYYRVSEDVAARLSAAGDGRMAHREMERLVEHHHGRPILSRFARAEEAYLRAERT